jgi:P4 family phage/plasmid primase-like protien
MNKVHYTVFQSSEPLSKRYVLGGDGTIVKTPAAQMTTGRARRHLVDFAKFDECLDKAGPNVAFCYGLHDFTNYGEIVKISTASKANPAKKILARTREFFDYRVEPGILMIDHDPHPGGPMLTPGELRTLLAQIYPPFTHAACWIRGSLSAGVHKKGESAKPGRGFHLYFAVANASDIPRFGKALFNRLWLLGHGFIALSAAGSCLVRSVIDAAVFDGERLDFVGKPIIGDGLEFTAPKPDYADGSCLDTQSFPDLTEAEQAQIKALIEQAKQAREADRLAKRTEWGKGKVKELMGRGVPETQARAQVGQIAKAGGSFDLYADYPLEFAQLGFATVKVVLANPDHYEGQALADPLEGPDYGRTTAKFYANTREGKPVINSNAHGGQMFFLHAEDEPPVNRHTPPPDFPLVKQADCTRFKAWLLDAMNGNTELVEFLRAFIKACLTGRADLQKLLMLLGPGGTGKGTFLRILIEMLGQGNCTSTDLRSLETNRFEAAKLYGKRLTSITDAGRYTGSIDRLKAITGQDQNPYEEKHQQQRGTFVYGGMVVIASNEQPAFSDYSSGPVRRILVVRFNRRYTEEEKAKFRQNQGEAGLLAETPAIIQWALQMDNKNLEHLFSHPPKASVDAAMEV